MATSAHPMVLVVCTANRCRSPLAAAVLRQRCADLGLRWTVETAGVRARPAEVTTPSVLTVLDEVGIAAEVQPARQVDPAVLRRADLVLTAERAHRSAVLDVEPELVGRVFTLLEFERLLAAARSGGRVTSPIELARLADSARALAGPSRDDDDLTDPIGAPLDAYRQCREVVSRAVERIVATAAPLGG